MFLWLGCMYALYTQKCESHDIGLALWGCTVDTLASVLSLNVAGIIQCMCAWGGGSVLLHLDLFGCSLCFSMSP